MSYRALSLSIAIAAGRNHAIFEFRFWHQGGLIQSEILRQPTKHVFFIFWITETQMHATEVCSGHGCSSGK